MGSRGWGSVGFYRSLSDFQNQHMGTLGTMEDQMNALLGVFWTYWQRVPCKVPRGFFILGESHKTSLQGFKSRGYFILTISSQNSQIEVNGDYCDPFWSSPYLHPKPCVMHLLMSSHQVPSCFSWSICSLYLKMHDIFYIFWDLSGLLYLFNITHFYRSKLKQWLLALWPLEPF